MKTALLLIDLQNDYLKQDGLLPHADRVIEGAAALLEGFRRRRLPVVHIRTTIRRHDDRRLPHWREAGRWLCVEGSDGHASPAALAPLPGEPVFHKSGYNAFADAPLDHWFREAGADRVILCGVHLHACVRTAATECLERNLRVTIADDATGSNDPLHAAATRRWLAARSVSFQSVTAVLAGLDGGAATVMAHRSPCRTGEVLFETPIEGAAEVDAAAAEARDAFERRSRLPLESRLAPLAEAARRIEAEADQLARQIAIDTGKPFSHALEECRRAVKNVRDVIARAARFDPARPEGSGEIRYRPVGVIAMISPWNNPVAIPAGKIAPALAYGNTMVWKPAPAGTRIAEWLLGCFVDAGVDESAVRLIRGDHSTAQLVAANRAIDAVTITGSRQAGFSIQDACAGRGAPIQAELNGNNAAIVWDDADFEMAAAQVAWGAFGFAGQRCTANRRVIVPESRCDELMEALIAAGEKLAWGDPLDPATEIGPMIDACRRDQHAADIARARQDGAVWRVEMLQQRKAGEAWVGGGAFAQPAIVCCDDRSHPLVEEETMSPLLVVERARDFDHALELCNGVRYGLAAALFSNSPRIREEFLRRAQAGILRIGSSTAGADVTLPFGGWKASGIGPPEHGEADRLFYTRMQAVYGGRG